MTLTTNLNDFYAYWPLVSNTALRKIQTRKHILYQSIDWFLAKEQGPLLLSWKPAADGKYKPSKFITNN
jgi:hypothetical protein